MGQPLKYNLAGLRFGQILVLKRLPGNTWLCQCDCGSEKSIYGGSLRNGLTRSCGCLNRKVSAAKARDLTGTKVGRLSIIAKTQDGKWSCRCECGTELCVPHRALIKSETKSCGCLKVDVLRVLHKTHGKSQTRAHRIWGAMKQRCYNKKRTRYRDYGGRGITVCDAWKNSFEAFFADMGDPPSEDYSIDRIDNDGNYEPGNCRWATALEQNQNKRDI